MHIHHAVPGIVLLISGASMAVGFPPVSPYREIAAVLIGIGSSLVLDEFALILHLEDVYWAEEGRLSVDAVAVATGVSGILLLGGVPFISDLTPYEGESDLAVGITVAVVLALDLVLAAITLLKGKLLTGLVGLFFPILLVVGAIRLARPMSIWARKRYEARNGRSGHPRKLAAARRREVRFREPIQRFKVTLQDAVAGAPTAADEPTAAEPDRVEEQPRSPR
jgi:hypothetical protein